MKSEKSHSHQYYIGIFQKFLTVYSARFQSFHSLAKQAFWKKMIATLLRASTDYDYFCRWAPTYIIVLDSFCLSASLSFLLLLMVHTNILNLYYYDQLVVLYFYNAIIITKIEELVQYISVPLDERTHIPIAEADLSLKRLKLWVNFSSRFWSTSFPFSNTAILPHNCRNWALTTIKQVDNPSWMDQKNKTYFTVVKKMNSILIKFWVSQKYWHLLFYSGVFLTNKVLTIFKSLAAKNAFIGEEK